MKKIEEMWVTTDRDRRYGDDYLSLLNNHKPGDEERKRVEEYIEFLKKYLEK